MWQTDPLIPIECWIQKRLAQAPPSLSRWLGYRGKAHCQASAWVVCSWGLIGAFGGLSTIYAVFGYSEYFKSRAVPPLIASYGAGAILCYGAMEVPLAQPRALIFGHFFSGLTGIIVAKIFQLDLAQDEFPPLQWIAASLATAIALVVMNLTKTTHPPGGATALLPCIDRHVWALGWYLLPVLLLSSSLMLVTALVVNNIQQQYPKFWVAQLPTLPPAGEKLRTEKSDMTGGSSIANEHVEQLDLESGRRGET